MILNILFGLESNYYNLNNSRWEPIIEDNAIFVLDIIKNELVSPLMNI